MSRYRVIESVGGNEPEVIIAKTPMEAIIKYLKHEDVNLATGHWNWDFEVSQLRRYERGKSNV